MLQLYTMLFLTCYMAFYICVALLPILLPVLTIAHTIFIGLILIASDHDYNLTYNLNITLSVLNLIILYPTPSLKTIYDKSQYPYNSGPYNNASYIIKSQ